MKKFDLESELKSLRVPERSDEYWETFQQRMRAELRTLPTKSPRRLWFPQLAWNVGVAFACLVLGLTVSHSAVHALLKDEKQWCASLEQFPTHVRVLMQDEHGLHKLVGD